MLCYVMSCHVNKQFTKTSTSQMDMNKHNYVKTDITKSGQSDIIEKMTTKFDVMNYLTISANTWCFPLSLSYYKVLSSLNANLLFKGYWNIVMGHTPCNCCMFMLHVTWYDACNVESNVLLILPLVYYLVFRLR